jgi:phosphatidylinositol 3,5-bisphosphate 5-phosphatase
MSTYRKINEWKSHSRDMVESFKRYYHNSFLDAQRQEAYNLFLGNYIFTQGQPMLWDLQTDYYLHHLDPRLWSDQGRRSYINWYTPEFLEPRSLPATKIPGSDQAPKSVTYYDDYWLEYYRPLAISSFTKIFSWKISNRPRYLSDGSYQQGPWNPSPFIPRKPPHTGPDTLDSPGKKPRKGVTIVDPNSDDQGLAINVPPTNGELPQGKQSILRDTAFEPLHSAASNASSFVPADKTAITQWTLNQFYENSLNPSVTPAEMQEYDRYISHPLNLPLVVSSEEPDEIEAANLDYVDYLSSISGDSAVAQFGLINEWDVSEEDLADFMDFLTVAENPLTVGEGDGEKKRYKAYRQWLRGKSLFKQSKVDPEYRS